jgi:choline-sulfatase
MRPANLLFTLSDQHGRDMSGCYGHPLIQTPHLDRFSRLEDDHGPARSGWG